MIASDLRIEDDEMRTVISFGGGGSEIDNSRARVYLTALVPEKSGGSGVGNPC